MPHHAQCVAVACVCVTGLDLQPGHVRDLVLRSANVSVAYLLDRCLDDAEGLPWSLCVGNIQDNLQSLVAGPPPVPGSTAAKLSVLVRLGFNRVVLEEAVQCIGHVKFSTITAEQLHGSIAVCHRAHPEYEQIALRRKTFCHMIRCLLPMTTPTDIVATRALAAVARLQRRQPQKCTGRQTFVKHIVPILARSRPSMSSSQVSEMAMQSHGSLWLKLDEAERALGADC